MHFSACVFSLAFSVVVIYLLSHVKVLRRYMLFIKDRPYNMGKENLKRMKQD